MAACISVDVPPDPVAIARCLSAVEEGRIALLHASERSEDPLARWSFVAVMPDRRSERIDPLADWSVPDPSADPALGTQLHLAACAVTGSKPGLVAIKGGAP